jgi:hypothetical protein
VGDIEERGFNRGKIDETSYTYSDKHKEELYYPHTFLPGAMKFAFEGFKP